MQIGHILKVTCLGELGAQSDVYNCLVSLWLTCVGLEAWVTLQKSKTAVKALLRDITVSDHQPSAIFPKVSFHLLLLINCVISKKVKG